nr:anthranilate phosphoribosyltransferase [Sandaracinobacteroides sayramensis]
MPDPGRPLDKDAAADAFHHIVGGDLADSDIAAFLLALAERGETADEIAAAASVLRQLMLPVSAPEGAIDLCGTGGDGSHSLNVSTAATFVVAAAGVPVAKHGNRGASSRSGTADVLEALGWQSDLAMDRVEAALHEIGVTFLFAQRHHPALARVAPVRRALGRRTIFNLLGPLANPAGVPRQMIGVAAPEWLEPIARAGAALGGTEILTVHGGGLDEIAVHGQTDLRRLREGVLIPEAFDPQAHDLGLHAREAIAGGDPPENAAELRALMEGRGRPAYRAIVLANAAAALTLTGRTWDRALADARTALDSGAAADKLARFLAFR